METLLAGFSRVLRTNSCVEINGRLLASVQFWLSCGYFRGRITVRAWSAKSFFQASRPKLLMMSRRISGPLNLVLDLVAFVTACAI
jgi:hypothetical protein